MAAASTPIRTILVTGANGFCGSHALAALSGRTDVRLIAAVRDAKKLPPIFSCTVREGDLMDPDYRRSVLDGVDAVVHAASWTSVWSNSDNAKRYNLVPTLAFIEAAKQAGVSRFVSISSTSLAVNKRPSFWPHLCTVADIEDHLQTTVDDAFSVINLRLGLFAGSNYGLGLLPLLLPRLKTHLVPWVAGGRTAMPIIDGRDIGQALALAALAPNSPGYDSIDVIGPEPPSVREVITHLHDHYGVPKPHFSVPFAVAYPFASMMEALDPIVPWDPLVTRSIVLLLEDTHANNDTARLKLGYQPEHAWSEAISTQISEMNARRHAPMYMAKPLPS